MTGWRDEKIITQPYAMKHVHEWLFYLWMLGYNTKTNNSVVYFNQNTNFITVQNEICFVGRHIALRSQEHTQVGLYVID